MPTHEGKKLVSETVVRKKNQCRVLLTVEVELSKETMDTTPPYMTDATDVMRAVLEPFSTAGALAGLLEEMRHDGELTVLSTKLEANK